MLKLVLIFYFYFFSFVQIRETLEGTSCLSLGLQEAEPGFYLELSTPRLQEGGTRRGRACQGCIIELVSVLYGAWLIFNFESWSSQRLYKWWLLRTVPLGKGMRKMYCLASIFHKFTLDCTHVGSKVGCGLCFCGCSAGSLSPLQVNRKNLGWEARKKHLKQV